MKFKIGDKVKINDIEAEIVNYSNMFNSYRIKAGNYTWNVKESELSPIKKTIRDVQIGEILINTDQKMEVVDVASDGIIGDDGHYYTFERLEDEGWVIAEVEKGEEKSEEKSEEKEERMVIFVDEEQDFVLYINHRCPKCNEFISTKLERK